MLADEKVSQINNQIHWKNVATKDTISYKEIIEEKQKLIGLKFMQLQTVATV